MADASMWPVVVVDPEDDHLACEYPYAGSMAKWLQQRGSGMRELTLRASEHCCICSDPRHSVARVTVSLFYPILQAQLGAMQMRGLNTYMVEHALLHTAPAAPQLQQLRILTHCEGAHHISVEALV